MVFVLAAGVSPVCTAKEALAGKPQQKSYLDFNGRHFYKAFTDSKKNLTMMEYIPRGENIDHWNELMTVMVFPNIPKEVGAKGYLRDMVKQLEANDPPAQYEILGAKDSNVSVLAFLVLQQKPAEIIAEWNLMRFVYIDNAGLIVLQYAKRQYYPNNDRFSLEMGPELRKWRAEWLTPFLKADFIEKRQ
ncbi:MAG: hypothetical protein JXB10_04485 [Pirellulales bacterium]|nr:hypothetical protein [Pirellulales bacterium]